MVIGDGRGLCSSVAIGVHLWPPTTLADTRPGAVSLRRARRRAAVHRRRDRRRAAAGAGLPGRPGRPRGRRAAAALAALALGACRRRTSWRRATRRRWLLAVTALAAFFRCYRLNQPGLWGDDAINGLLALDVLDGTHPLAVRAGRRTPHSVFHALSSYPIAGAFRALRRRPVDAAPARRADGHRRRAAALRHRRAAVRRARRPARGAVLRLVAAAAHPRQATRADHHRRVLAARRPLPAGARAGRRRAGCWSRWPPYRWRCASTPTTRPASRRSSPSPTCAAALWERRAPRAPARPRRRRPASLVLGAARLRRAR